MEEEKINQADEKKAEEDACFPHRECSCNVLSCVTTGLALGIATTIVVIKLLKVFK